ncbi:MAG: ATP-dependent nuclease, partial [Cetobacterium sp.]
MDIKRIVISNWQNIDYINIEIEKLLVLIGDSNNGKTSILKAISAALGNYEITENDFKDKNKLIEIKIKCYSEKIGFITFKIVKKNNYENEYYVLNHKIETKISLIDLRERYFEMKGIIINSKDKGIYESLIKIKEIFLLKDMDLSLIKDLDSKIDYLKNNILSEGLQRKIFFNFLKSILNKIEEKRLKIDTYNLFLMFEEPELHLNPQASREMYSLLVKLSKIGIQIILETHSSYFVGLKQYKSICIVKKIGKNIETFQYKGKLLNGDEIKNFNMNYWINPDRGEMFFAKKVILVEGQTDKIALSYLAKKLGIYN